MMESNSTKIDTFNDEALYWSSRVMPYLNMFSIVDAYPFDQDKFKRLKFSAKIIPLSIYSDMAWTAYIDTFYQGCDTLKEILPSLLR